MTPSVPSYSSPFEFDMLLLEPVHEMMQTGIRVDQQKMQEYHEQYHEDWESAQKKLDIIAGRPLNVNSPKQLKEFLYEELGMRVRRLRRSPTTNEDALRSIMAEAYDKIQTLQTDSAKTRWKRAYAGARLVLNIRSLRKRISSYIDIDFDVDGRIRSTISVGGTETGRFSHSKTLWDTGLNIATIPRELRDMFIADDGYVLVEIDLNRGESWVYAHLSEDPELLRIHQGGLDFHAETAATISTVFSDEPRSVEWIIAHKEGEAYKLRYLGKKLNHASAYRMGPHRGTEVVNSEADDTGITITHAQFKSAQELWLMKYSQMESWWMEIERDLGQDLTLRTPYGRERQFHDRWGPSLFKEATAYVPQSTSVDYINRGMLKVYHLFQKRGAWDLKLLSQTHDSILFEVREESLPEAVPEVSEALLSSLTIKGRTFSIPVEASYGQSWGTTEEYALP